MNDSAEPKQRLSIGLEFRLGALHAGTGIVTYRNNLRDAVRNMDVQTLILSDNADDARTIAPDPSVRLEIRRNLFQRAQRWFTLTGQLTRLRMESPPDIFHWSHPQPLFVEGARNLYTIHDIIPISHPHLTGIRPVRFERLLRALVANQAHFTAVSHASEAELRGLFPELGERLDRTFEAVPIETSAAPLPGNLEHDGYFIAVGRVEPRKNLERLVVAWELAGARLPLVIVGPDGDSPGVRELCQWLATRPIVRLPWLPRDALVSLMSHARALLMPSLAEGFGLSAVEAMALGVPAMVSARGAAREIAGPGALIVDPENISDIAAGIRSLDTNQPLRDRLIASGRIRAAAFSPAAFEARLEARYGGHPIVDDPALEAVEDLRACAS
jgi:glycosyltransferase involved in cell wall biosynthesis